MHEFLLDIEFIETPHIKKEVNKKNMLEFIQRNAFFSRNWNPCLSNYGSLRLPKTSQQKADIIKYAHDLINNPVRCNCKWIKGTDSPNVADDKKFAHEAHTLAQSVVTRAIENIQREDQMEQERRAAELASQQAEEQARLAEAELIKSMEEFYQKLLLEVCGEFYKIEIDNIKKEEEEARRAEEEARQAEEIERIRNMDWHAHLQNSDTMACLDEIIQYRGRQAFIREKKNEEGTWTRVTIEQACKRKKTYTVKQVGSIRNQLYIKPMEYEWVACDKVDHRIPNCVDVKKRKRNDF